jgi:hypothetical protein
MPEVLGGIAATMLLMALSMILFPMYPPWR